MGLPRLVHFQRRDLCVFLLIITAILWFYGPLTLVLSSSLEDEYAQHYSHLILIPFLCVYLLYLQRAAIFATVEWSPFLGPILMVIGGAVSFSAKEPISEALDNFSPTIISFVMVCWGAFLFCYGTQAFRAASFGLGLMIFIVPFPSFVLDAIVGFLQRSSADAVELLFSALSTPVIREGFIFKLSNFTIFIAEECSGIRSFLALGIISLVAGYWFLTSMWARVALVTVIIPLAIIKNAFRIVGLTLLANYVDPTYITDSALHRTGGIPLFLLSLAVLVGVVWLLRRWECRPASRMVQ
ncbi:MAG: exosortase [Nitrospira sp.]|nr:exosortase [Nitrospira sp.]